MRTYRKNNIPASKSKAHRDNSRVNRFADVDAGDAGRIRVPIDVSLKWAVGDVTHRMVEATLQINQPIDADVFTIPRSRANNIWSEPKVRRRGAGTPDEPEGHLPLILINFGVLLVGIVVFFLWRRNAKSRGRKRRARGPKS